MFERRVYSAELRGLVLQLVHNKASLSRGDHRHGVHLHRGGASRVTGGIQLFTSDMTPHTHNVSTVASLRHLQGHHGGGGPGVPELQREAETGASV